MKKIPQTVSNYTDPKKKRPFFKWILFALKQISKTRFV